MLVDKVIGEDALKSDIDLFNSKCEFILKESENGKYTVGLRVVENEKSKILFCVEPS
jgi:hypothetical protein